MDADLSNFIIQHAHEGADALLLKHSDKVYGFDVSFAVEQIRARQKTASKLPSFVACADFMFPSLLAAEQSTNEEIARWHASLVCVDGEVADLTAGLGIDTMCMAHEAKHVSAFELIKANADALRDNLKALGVSNVTVENADSIAWLEDHPDARFDTIFIDPHRRDDKGGRAYGLSDCRPDVVKHLPLLLAHAGRVIIKASPMLDITQTIRDLSGIERLFIAQWHGECKEILAVVKRNGVLREITAISFPEGREYSVSTAEGVKDALIEDASALEGAYLYRPWASVMKMGRMARLTERFPDLRKLDNDTRLYTSTAAYPDFPGTRLKIMRIVKPRDVKGLKVNVICRNYPLTSAQLAAKLKIREGGDEYLYAARVKGKPMLMMCVRG